MALDKPFQFDNSQGTITNLSGTLVLPSFQSTLAGTFYAAAGATIQLGGGTTNTRWCRARPWCWAAAVNTSSFPVIYTCAANVPISNLSLQGGLLELGAGFQGGAITNLTLDGITLTQTNPRTILPVNGTFIDHQQWGLRSRLTVRVGLGSMEAGSLEIIRWQWR
jgi:hypothetical protein